MPNKHADGKTCVAAWISKELKAAGLARATATHTTVTDILIDALERHLNVKPERNNP